ncbi:MAG: hypothetical protein AB7O97_20845 [Planctomycetota bacterium]
MTPERLRDEGGFSFLELTIVSALLVVLMAIVGTSTQSSTRSLRADEVVAHSMETLQRSAVRMSQILRPCSIITYRVVAVAADVPLVASAIGDWIEPVEGEARAAVRFQCADGQLSLNAAQLTQPRAFRLQLDPEELDNDLDDDGDGMIDEGAVMLEYDGIELAIATNIESLSFTLTGRVLDIRVSSAARDASGNLQRFSVTETLYLRNN